MVFVARPVSAAVAAIVPVAADPPETVVPSADVVPYSNLGVVDIVPAIIVPFKVADVEPTDVGLFVVIDIDPTASTTFAAVHPPLGLIAATSLAAWASRSVAISASDTPASFITS